MPCPHCVYILKVIRDVQLHHLFFFPLRIENEREREREMLRTKMWIVFNSSITFTRWHERRSRPLNKLFACVCVSVSACVQPRPYRFGDRRKGEQGQTGGWACNAQRKWKARGRMTKPSSRSFYILPPPPYFLLYTVYTPSIVYLNCPQGPL